ncbi:hypothetical protein QYM36_013888 [Artemia franciscana]|uniref:Uncharacterized protein n=1 Tax=Artemia franciscana TaxID=6661 RepID=A0AA88HM84_ARTSF|nr:hypothetical protein QYM36_013888 [Artemia franciscana]
MLGFNTLHNKARISNITNITKYRISNIENSNITTTDSATIVNNTIEKLKKVPGESGTTKRKKLEDVLNKTQDGEILDSWPKSTVDRRLKQTLNPSHHQTLDVSSMYP